MLLEKLEHYTGAVLCLVMANAAKLYRSCTRDENAADLSRKGMGGGRGGGSEVPLTGACVRVCVCFAMPR